VIAKNISYTTKQLKVPAGAAITVNFKNEDTVPHNMDFTVDQAGSQTFYKRDPLPGPISSSYQFTAPKAGTYYYHCDVHPNMTGTLTVTGSGGVEPGQAASPSTTASGGTASETTAPKSTSTTAAGNANPRVGLVAQNIAFDPTTLTLKANTLASILFTNKDAVPHNVDITTDPGGDNTLYKQDPATGPIQSEYTFKTPAPGKLYFHCDVHPNMKGTINVQ
jgi:plastocyanin